MKATSPTSWRIPSTSVPFFAATGDGRRERSGSDVLILIASAVGLALFASVAVPPSAFEAALIDLLESISSAVHILWRLGAASLLLWVSAVVLTTLIRRRFEVLIDIAATAVVGVLASVLAYYWIEGHWPSVSQFGTGGSHGSIPLASMALGIAVALAASPHLSMPFRRLGRWVVLAALVSTALLGSTSPSGALVTWFLAAGSAAAVHLALGSRAGRPSLAEVRATLEALGVEAQQMEMAPRQSGGVLVVDARVDDRPVTVKVYGRDARDTQLLSRLWRASWYRNAGPVALTRLQQVEHEGFITLLAASKGVEVADVVVAGGTNAGDALIVLATKGTTLSDADDATRRDFVPRVWSAIQSLHQAGIAHGAITPDSFVVADSRVGVADLGNAVVAPNIVQINSDLAQTLVCTALLVGIERAVLAAAEALGEEQLEAILPYIQLPAMNRPVRVAIKDSDIDVDAVRSAAAGVIGVEEPEMVELRRVSPQTLVMVALLVIVAIALITSLGEVDPAELWHTITEGEPVWLVSAVIVAQLPFFAQAISTRGACPRPLPYGPVVMLQAAIAFVALAVPSTAGRLALGIRFFQRQGVPATAAVSISAVDSFSGFLVQIALLIMTLGFGLGSVDLQLDVPQDRNLDGLLVLLGIVAAAVVLAVVIALSLPAIRHRIFDRLRPLVAEVTGVLRNLRSVSKLAQLFGGNLLDQLLYAAALGACLLAFGERLNLATLVVIYVGAALFGGLMPVPGGIGVMEAALMAGLIAAGIEPTTATATALTFRVFTFYLPPAWGWMATRWLQRRSYL